MICKGGFYHTGLADGSETDFHQRSYPNWISDAKKNQLSESYDNQTHPNRANIRTFHSKMSLSSWSINPEFEKMMDQNYPNLCRIQRIVAIQSPRRYTQISSRAANFSFLTGRFSNETTKLYIFGNRVQIDTVKESKYYFILRKFIIQFQLCNTPIDILFEWTQILIHSTKTIFLDPI